jgi:hypothetical protein
MGSRSVVLAFALFVGIPLPSSPDAEAASGKQEIAPSQPEPSAAEKAHAAITPGAKVTVYLADKSKLSGHVTYVGDTTFTMVLDDKAHTPRLVSYDEVEKITSTPPKPPKPSKPPKDMSEGKQALIVFGGLLLMIVVFGAIHAY